MHKLEIERLDRLVKSLEKKDCDKIKTIVKMISLIRSVSVVDEEKTPIVDKVKNIIEENLSEDISVLGVAKKAGISLYYMSHVFKKKTSITVLEYIHEIRLIKAKEMLLTTDKKIAIKRRNKNAK